MSQKLITSSQARENDFRADLAPADIEEMGTLMPRRSLSARRTKPRSYDARAYPPAGKNIPVPIAAIVREFAEAKAQTDLRAFDHPKQQKDETDAADATRVHEWARGRKGARAWLDAHSNSPHVRQAIDAVKAKGWRSQLPGETREEAEERYRRFNTL